MISEITKDQFLKFFPRYDYVATKLIDNHIPFAIFAGSEVWLLTNSRIPTDLDILVKDEDLKRIADLFHQELKVKQKEDISAEYILIDNVELVANINISKEGNVINISFIQEMVNNLLKLNLSNEYILPLLPPEDTIIIKALLKRGSSEGKFDLQDIDALKSKVTLDSKYLKQRIMDLKVEVLLGHLIN